LRLRQRSIRSIRKQASGAAKTAPLFFSQVVDLGALSSAGQGPQRTRLLKRIKGATTAR
jgi:hypothetical protein